MATKKTIVEVFSSGDRASQELMNRLFELPLRDCLILVRDIGDRPFAPRERRASDAPTIAIDGRVLALDANGRINPDMLRQELGHALEA